MLGIIAKLTIKPGANGKQSAIHVFQEALVWAGHLVVGFGEAVHIISLASHAVSSHFLDGYFGHLYATKDALLVSDAAYLWRMTADGSIAWRSAPLGIDGVVVTAVEDDVVRGEGEYDPPGGWKPFRVALATGRPITD